MHSVFSDGEFSPSELVDLAERNQVSVLSLTDHDTFDGIPEFLQSAEATDITAFPGIEITVKFHNFNIHMLAYFKDYESINPKLRDRVKKMTQTRETRMRQLIERVNEVIPDRFQGKIIFENGAWERGTSTTALGPGLLKKQKLRALKYKGGNIMKY